ncbi:MAG: hypothetical protein V3S69_07975, partial [Dehalococcoidales bacterium]
LQVVRNHIDKYASVVEGNCIQYTTRQKSGLKQFLDSRKVEQLFTDLYGEIGQHHVRSSADLADLQRQVKGNNHRTVTSLKSLYQNG